MLPIQLKKTPQKPMQLCRATVNTQGCYCSGESNCQHILDWNY